MAPQTITSTVTYTERNIEEENITTKILKTKHHHAGNTHFQTNLKWPNIIAISTFHAIAAYGLITFPYLQKIKLFIFGK